MTELATTIAHRTARFLERQGLLERDAEQAYLTSDGDEGSMDGLIEPAITYRIAVGPHQGRKVMTLQTLPPDDPFEPGAGQVAGFSLHAGVAARAHERDKLERLCRYVSRPPVAERRLSLTTHSLPRTRSGGNIRYRLKTPYRDGTTHIIFEPLDFIAKLAALVPRPRVNLTRYHGVFAPNSRLRAQITPAAARRSTPASDSTPEDLPKPRTTMSWAQRLKRVFNIDIETCGDCGGTLKIIACIEDPAIIHKILAHLDRKIARTTQPTPTPAGS